MSASHPSPDAPRCTICGKAATRQDIDGEWWPPCPHAMKFGIHTLAARSSAPTFPPKPLLTDANAADRCVHGTYPPAICEHCQRQATTPAAPSEGPTPPLPVPAQEAEAERLLRMIRANCRVVYYPPEVGTYVIEHAPLARKDAWDAIVWALRDRSQDQPSAPTVPETSNG